MNHDKRKAIPETDEDARELLLGDDPTTGNCAMHGIYIIMRQRDGLNVFDAYMATLNHVIGIQERAIRSSSEAK